MAQSNKYGATSDEGRKDESKDSKNYGKKEATKVRKKEGREVKTEVKIEGREADKEDKNTEERKT